VPAGGRGLALLRAVDPAATLWRAALAGAAFGVYTLTRVDGLYIVLVAAVWLALASGLPRARVGSRIAALLLAWSLVVAPYVLRNWQTFGAPVLSTNEGIVLFLGHNRAYAHVHPNYDIDLMEPHVEQLAGIAAHRVSAAGDRQLREAALRYIVEHPVETFWMSLRKLGWAYGWHMVPRHWENSRPTFDPVAGRVVERGAPRPSWLVLAWWRRRSAGLSLLSLLVALNAVELVAAYPDTRYRLAVEPYLALLAGLGMVSLWAAAARRWWGSGAGVVGQAVRGAGPPPAADAAGMASEQCEGEEM
jgi:hypothetical protein